MTDLELIAVFAGSWIVAAAVWMLLDWAARPKHARFRPKGDRIHRGPFSYRHFRRVRRAEESEEIRLRLQQRYGRPTLAVRNKRQTRVIARHDRMVTGIGATAATAVASSALGSEAPDELTDTEAAAALDAASTTVEADPVSEPVYWTELRDQALGFGAQNDERLANGEPPTRYNPIIKDDETMAFDGTSGAWPAQTVDPFADGVQETDADTESGDPSDSTDPDGETDSAHERAVRDLEHLPEAG